MRQSVKTASGDNLEIDSNCKEFGIQAQQTPLSFGIGRNARDEA